MVIALRVLACALLASWAWIVPSVAVAMDMELVMTQELASAIKAGMAMTAHSSSCAQILAALDMALAPMENAHAVQASLEPLVPCRMVVACHLAVPMVRATQSRTSASVQEALLAPRAWRRSRLAPRTATTGVSA